MADIIPSRELDLLRETTEVLSDSDLVRDLHEGLADARDGRVFSSDQIAADLAARRAADARTVTSRAEAEASASLSADDVLGAIDDARRAQ
jgi:hypothetical protein